MFALEVTMSATQLVDAGFVPTAPLVPPRVDGTPWLPSPKVPPLESPSLTSPPSSSNRSTCGAAVTTPRVVGLASEGGSPARQNQPLRTAYDKTPTSPCFPTEPPTWSSHTADT